MAENTFPENETDMPERIWQTYCCLVWCNNSLNSLSGYLHHILPHAAIYVERAQSVITFLLTESGRLDEFKKWQLEYEKEVVNG